MVALWAMRPAGVLKPRASGRLIGKHRLEGTERERLLVHVATLDPGDKLPLIGTVSLNLSARAFNPKIFCRQ